MTPCEIYSEKGVHTAQVAPLAPYFTPTEKEKVKAKLESKKRAGLTKPQLRWR